MKNEAAAAVILPWVKENYPERYKQTLEVASNEDTFARFLARLVELRWEEEPDVKWLLQIPLSMLEQTKLELRARLYGAEIVLAGQRVKDRSWSFAELIGLLRAGNETERRAMFEQLRVMKQTLDLRVEEVVIENADFS